MCGAPGPGSGGFSHTRPPSDFHSYALVKHHGYPWATKGKLRPRAPRSPAGVAGQWGVELNCKGLCVAQGSGTGRGDGPACRQRPHLSGPPTHTQEAASPPQRLTRAAGPPCREKRQQGHLPVSQTWKLRPGSGGGWEAHAAILPGGAESASLESSRAGAPPTAAPLGATRRAAQLDNQRGFGKGAWARAPPSRCHRAGGGCDHSCPEIPLSIPLAGPRLTPQTHRHSFLEARRDSEPPEGASVWAQGSFVNSPLPADPTSRPSPAPQQAPRSMGSGG